MFSHSMKNIKSYSKLIVNCKIMWTLVLLLSNLMVSVITSSVNYCGARMCANTNAHTFCQFREGPGPNCMGYIDSPLTKEEKARVMARLNRRRSEAASGQLRGFPPAGNMLKLRWVEELAREAQLWADQCRIPRIPEEHDVCRDLYSTTVGQCVASVVGEAPGLRVESMVDMWYMQNIHYKGNVTSYKLPPNYSGFYGDFGQILWANTYMVGCGRSRFMAPSQGRLRSVERLVCNFAPRGPPPSRALWSPSLPASACSSRSEPDRVLTALCTYQPELDETHDLDNSMTLEEHITLNAVLEMEGKGDLNYQGSLDELYLTKLAMITMAKIDTSTPYYISVQKRDIAEFILLEDAKADVYKIVSNKTILQNISAVVNMIQEDNATKNNKTLKRRVSFIGRPKSYNIEDLNDVKDELSTQNVIERHVEGALQREKDVLYAEYDVINIENENLTTSVASHFHEITTIEGIRSFKTISFTNTEITNGNVANMSPSFNESLEVIENLEDFNDSETVRELQEALDRMEQTLEPTFRALQGKVRRDLRDLPEKMDAAENKISDRGNIRVSPEELENNRTIERGPMLNMVLRYMPYLKQYEDGMLGKSANGCRVIESSSFSLAVSVCIYFYMLCF